MCVEDHEDVLRSLALVRISLQLRRRSQGSLHWTCAIVQR
jgi:hypothetical protein